jgi:hypothetical protein
MEEIKAQQELLGDCSYVGCIVWPCSKSHIFAIRYHRGEHKTKVRSIWTIMPAMIQQLKNMSSSLMIDIGG